MSAHQPISNALRMRFLDVQRDIRLETEVLEQRLSARHDVLAMSWEDATRSRLYLQQATDRRNLATLRIQANEIAIVLETLDGSNAKEVEK